MSFFFTGVKLEKFKLQLLSPSPICPINHQDLHLQALMELLTPKQNTTSQAGLLKEIFQYRQPHILLAHRMEVILWVLLRTVERPKLKGLKNKLAIQPECIRQSSQQKNFPVCQCRLLKQILRHHLVSLQQSPSLLEFLNKITNQNLQDWSPV